MTKRSLRVCSIPTMRLTLYDVQYYVVQAGRRPHPLLRGGHGSRPDQRVRAKGGHTQRLRVIFALAYFSRLEILPTYCSKNS
jgi:hypothetical protein